MRPQPLKLAWIKLLALTVLAAVAGQALAPRYLVAGVALLTFVKGRTVIGAFMDLDRAAPWLRRAVSGWLAVVIGATTTAMLL
ncbi:cytochrome C oxidase subunit IV family protein [Arhodomonas sp. SL1]|uniref:cytochrome C oxidase subunit IV family protein n=1 Tax=Arhodomonas sp. SL1 TaxID=3425691 RepID=UPI003F883F86